MTKNLLYLTALTLLLAGCASSSVASRADVQERALQQRRVPVHTASSIEEMLKFYPGVRLSRRGGGYEVRIRGAQHEPLFVIDGFPLTPIPGQTLLGLNPDDVERIEVLTAPSDLASYSDASGGVVLITTKRR